MHRIHVAIAITISPMLTALDYLFPVTDGTSKSPRMTRKTRKTTWYTAQPMVVPVRQTVPVSTRRRAG